MIIWGSDIKFELSTIPLKQIVCVLGGGGFSGFVGKEDSKLAYNIQWWEGGCENCGNFVFILNGWSQLVRLTGSRFGKPGLKFRPHL